MSEIDKEKALKKLTELYESIQAEGDLEHDVFIPLNPYTVSRLWEEVKKQNLEYLQKQEVEIDPKLDYPLMMIGWVDAISRDEPKWDSIENTIEWATNDDYVTHQVGWVLRDDDEFVLMFDKKATYDDDVIIAGAFKIPKPWIVYRRTLSVNE